MKCLSCGRELDPNNRFCMYCGASIKRISVSGPEQGTISCRTCGAPVEKGSSFCIKCGAAVEEEPPSTPVLRATAEGGQHPAHGSKLGQSGGNQQTTCSRCGSPVTKGDQFCTICGQAVGESASDTSGRGTAPDKGRTCPNCGTKLESMDAFCTNCGKQVPPDMKQASPVPGQVPPVPGHVPPVPGQASPVPGHVPPVPGQVSPVPGQASSVPGQVPPVPDRVPSVLGGIPTAPKNAPEKPKAQSGGSSQGDFRKIIIAVLAVAALVLIGVGGYYLAKRAGFPGGKKGKPMDDGGTASESLGSVIPETDTEAVSARVSAGKDSIQVGEQTEVAFEVDGTVVGEVTWESSDSGVLRVDETGVVTGVSQGSARIDGSYQGEHASVDITVTGEAADVSLHQDTSGGEPAAAPVGASGLGAVPQSTIDTLAEKYSAGPWDGKKNLQAVEWNTDSMAEYYVSNGHYISAYNLNGEEIAQCNDVGGATLFSMDYYDGKLFSVMRSSSYGKFKLRVYDAATMKLLLSTDLTDIHDQYQQDMKQYQSKLVPSLDAITVAPQIGGGDALKLYVSYNVYYSSKDSLALNEKQLLFEYDYNSSLRNGKKIQAERRLSVDLGPVEYGIQTLEYDRSSGHIWCAVRQGLSDHSLYCIDGQSQGDSLSLVSNGSQKGWNCKHAGDGMCSLGNDWYYILIPESHSGYTDATVQKLAVNQLEGH